MARLMRLACQVRPCCSETHESRKSRLDSASYIITSVKGEIRPAMRRISTSQISVIFYGIKTLDTVSLVVIAAL